jgi:hypothetical protein
MVTIANPFDAGGYSLAEMTEAINILPTVPLGCPATVANRDVKSMRSFTLPWIPHDDVITPQDIQGVRGSGVANAADPLATVMERKITRMRAKHAQTSEYMEINALEGIVKDGGGTIDGVLALVSPEFFDKLIGHAKVEEAYKYYSSDRGPASARRYAPPFSLRRYSL